MFSQTVEYALRAMIRLAALDGAPESTDRIAAHTHVPSGYLSKVMRDMVVANLVTSFRGPGGGFILAKRPGEISILDVVNAVDPIRRIEHCPLGDPRHTALCGLHRRLDDALAIIEQTFRTTTLADVLGTPGRCMAAIQSPPLHDSGDSHAPAA